KQPIATTPRERAEEAYRRAVQAAGQGRGLQAQAELQAALREDPGFTTGRLLLARMFAEQGRSAEAKALLGDGLAADAAQPALALALARLHVERNELDEAIRVLRRSAPAATGNAEFRGYLAGVLQKAGRAREAVDEYRGALQLSPQTGVWWMGLGLSLEADGRPGEAREAFLKARASGTLSPELAAFVDQKLR
ncbi:MAG: tetratricopeptide repeat protein, partial [Rhodocyclaceae bacterium]|nr:tetratricopeptide repeat protein [Rhodocyclaceae bacterium]